MKPIQRVEVFYRREKGKIPLGTLFLKDHQIWFEYAASFLKTGLELSPFKLPLRPGAFCMKEPIFEGLFGLFNDSLPDGWGRLLLDRKLLHQGMVPNSLSPLDRLCFVGNHGMGALCYEPAISEREAFEKIDLDKIAKKIWEVQEKDTFFEELFVLGGSSVGARPKIFLSEKGVDWIVKFPSSLDPKDIAHIEYAYHLMALKAKLNVPKAKLFHSKKGKSFFGVKRFDREGAKAFHMQTACALIHADYRIPSLDYEALLKMTLYLTKDYHERETQFRNVVFNVLAHNRDDHAKNFSFCMDLEGGWSVSPAYDLTFSSGPSGEHATTVMGEGKNPTQKNLLQLAEIAHIDSERALKIIKEVALATEKWEEFASKALVGATSKKLISSTLSRVKDRFFS